MNSKCAYSFQDNTHKYNIWFSVTRNCSALLVDGFLSARYFNDTEIKSPIVILIVVMLFYNCCPLNKEEFASRYSRILLRLVGKNMITQIGLALKRVFSKSYEYAKVLYLT